MNGIVVYSSQTGFTEKYAKWIAEDLNCEAISVKQAKKLDISQFDTVIYGGWCMEVQDDNGTVLGAYLYLKCYSGNCDKYKG